MEQQIDPKPKIDIAVGTDPAFVPGLTGPPPAVKEGNEEAGKRSAAEPEGKKPEPAAAGAAESDTTTGADADTRSDSDAQEEASKEAASKEAASREAADGPAFEVSDRRGSIAADRSGIRFTLDDQEAEFAWDEIGAVEVKPARFGRRFAVTVHVAANRWFNADVEAPARGRLKEWTEELDAVLDVYFEDA
ncbi:hypothetical protein AB0903_32140 [Streptomyces sp. NPDC048389]|uniref:hypothetical protein n=1 Tax=Streptomyces sp. NPDC048389 TaxID=3154622 RepID=UPI003452CB00